jgi:hypothetical protein
VGWKDAFGEAKTKLETIHEQLKSLDDLKAGVAALHSDLVESRPKILEQIRTGVIGLREENGDIRDRQDRMNRDLNETRGELRQLADLVDGLRPWAPGAGGRPGEDTPAQPQAAVPPAEPEPQAGDGPTASAEAHPSASSRTASQGGTMEHDEDRPRTETGSADEDLALKNAIEAAYKGAGPSAGQGPDAAAASGDAEDPRIAHGVLLLKAAGVASVELIAHRDTWEWLAALAVHHCHFRTPPSVEDIGEGRIRTVLSGRSLIALLIELWNTRSTAAPLQGDWTLAVTCYHRVRAALADVGGHGETIRIVLDDGLPGAGDRPALPAREKDAGENDAS